MITASCRWAALAVVLSALAAPAPAETPVSGTVTGEMRFGDEVIKLTHVYVMEPFILPDAPPDAEAARRLIVILSDRSYPGDLPPTSIDLIKLAFKGQYNGLQLEFDRVDGQLLFAQPSHVPEATKIPFSLAGVEIAVEQFGLAGGTVSVSVSTAPPKQANAVLPGSKIVIMRGTMTEFADGDPRGISVTSHEFDFSATFAAPIQPASRLLKTLFGHLARNSDIAKSYAAILEQERQSRIAAIKQQFVEFDQVAAGTSLDEVARDNARQQMLAGLPDARSISEKMARLEKIFVYQDNALLRFRQETFWHDQYRAPKAEMSVDQQSEDETSNQMTSNTTLRRDPFATIKILSTSKTSIDTAHYGTPDDHGDLTNITVVRQRPPEEVKQPWPLYGKSILPILLQEDQDEIHMILDNGVWRLARN